MGSPSSDRLCAGARAIETVHGSLSRTSKGPRASCAWNPGCEGRREACNLTLPMSIPRAVAAVLGFAMLVVAGCPAAPGGAARALRPDPTLDPKAKCGQ